MIKIKLYNHPEDFELVEQFCKGKGIAFPSRNEQIFIAIDNDMIIGLTGLKREFKIEPLIAANPVVALKLGKMIEGYALGTGVKVITATVPGDNKKHIAQLEKDGFVIRDTNITILEKEN